MIVIKSDREIELMRQAGHKLGRVFDRLAPLVVPGVSTHELDVMVEKLYPIVQGIRRLSSRYLCVSERYANPWYSF